MKEPSKALESSGFLRVLCVQMQTVHTVVCSVQWPTLGAYWSILRTFELKVITLMMRPLPAYI
jgi:hypothetical protein